jgi:hypothetical protein
VELQGRRDRLTLGAASATEGDDGNGSVSDACVNCCNAFCGDGAICTGESSSNADQRAAGASAKTTPRGQGIRRSAY